MRHRPVYQIRIADNDAVDENVAICRPCLLARRASGRAAARKGKVHLDLSEAGVIDHTEDDDETCEDCSADAHTPVRKHRSVGA